MGKALQRRWPASYSMAQRIAEGIELDANGCWLWQRSMDKSGYGRIRRNDRSFMAHRVAYEEFVGPIPDGLMIDHLCRVRRCVNPAHLEPVTARENAIRSPWNSATQCRKGHPRTDDNTRFRPDGRRICLACHRLRSARRRVGETSSTPTLHGLDRHSGRLWLQQAQT